MSPDGIIGVHEPGSVQGLWDLPLGWVWASLQAVTEPVETLDPRSEVSGQFTYIDLSATSSGKIQGSQIVAANGAPPELVN